MKTTDNGYKLRKFIYDKFVNEEISNQDLVQVIILCFELLNLLTIQQFCKKYKKTYRGVKLFNKNLIEVNKMKFIIDN